MTDSVGIPLFRGVSSPRLAGRLECQLRVASERKGE